MFATPRRLRSVTALVASAMLVLFSVALQTVTGSEPGAGIGFRPLAPASTAPLSLNNPAPEATLDLGPVSLPRGAEPVVTLVLSLRIELDPTSPPGTLALWDERGGSSAILLRVRWKPHPSGSLVEWDTLDLFEGARRGQVLDHRLELTVRNIVPDDWRRPSTAPLRLHLSRDPALRVRQVAILAGSGVELARRGPASIALQVAVPRQLPPPGEPLTLRLLLAPRGRAVPQHVRLEVLPSPCVETPSPLAWDRIERPVVASLSLVRRELGPCTVSLSWTAGGHGDTVNVSLPVARER